MVNNHKIKIINVTKKYLVHAKLRVSTQNQELVIKNEQN